MTEPTTPTSRLGTALGCAVVVIAGVGAMILWGASQGGLRTEEPGSPNAEPTPAAAVPTTTPPVPPPAEDSMTSKPGRMFVKTTERILEHDEHVEGVLFPKGTRVVENDNHALHYWWPSRDITVDGFTILAGTQIDPPTRGHLRQLWTQPGQRILDLVIEGGGVNVRFTDAGQLESIHFPTPTLVRGLLVQYGVDFHPTPGAPVKHALLVEPTTIGGAMVKPGEVYLDVQGRAIDPSSLR